MGARGRWEVVVALGSNEGARGAGLRGAVRALGEAGLVDVARVSALYESAPMYEAAQPPFLNAAVRGSTALGPRDLLAGLKALERAAGRRAGGVRFGPRPLDLDIIFYGSRRLALGPEGGVGGCGGGALEVPHPRWHERPFVLAPLADLAEAPLGAVAGAGGEATSGPGGRTEGGGELGEGRSVESFMQAACAAWERSGGEARVGGPDLRRVVAVGESRLENLTSEPRAMGVLNVTPDSFSDGGRHLEVAAALAQARRLVEAGAGIIDVGGQSTRPGATRVGPEEELARVGPVVRALAADSELRGALVSVDTFYAHVAKETARLGAQLINDVSAGRLDPDMFRAMAENGLPYVMMHSRGDPETMQREEHTTYSDLPREAAEELGARVAAAEAAGVSQWQVLTDPGLGFAKTHAGNWELLAGLERFRRHLPSAALRRAPMVFGASRKGFLAPAGQGPAPADRDVASAAAAALATAQGANIVRAHDVSMTVSACRVGWETRQSRGVRREDSMGSSSGTNHGGGSSSSGSG